MDKARFRKQSLAQLRSIPKVRARLYDHKINAILEQGIGKLNPKSVMLYIPLESEVDIMPLINSLRRKGIPVYVPFMVGESFRLVKYRLPIKRKKYGVREPNFSKKYRNRMIDIAVIPIVGTDSSWRRVGFGKGMYDRFFSLEERWIGHTVFVQRILQQCKSIITDDWDIKADEMITAR
jgi:5-formyltetrahydrofolate cyclo-ligase